MLRASRRDDPADEILSQPLARIVTKQHLGPLRMRRIEHSGRFVVENDLKLVYWSRSFRLAINSPLAARKGRPP